jgi:hypothetical protein
MLLGEKVISRETFLAGKLRGRKHNIQFLPCPYLNSKNLVVGNE